MLIDANRRPRVIVWPLWKRACGGQFGFLTWVSLAVSVCAKRRDGHGMNAHFQSAAYGPIVVIIAMMVNITLPAERLMMG